MNALDSPFVVFVVALVAQWASAYAGDIIRKKVRPFRQSERDDFDVLRAASLTLLGLIIGFSFAMAVSRYDQRKNLEETEANAIGTEYLRADLLPAGNASRIRELLRNYITERISFYTANNEREVGTINAGTQRLQADLWNAVTQVAGTQQTPVVALVVSGMNDVLNSQGYTQAAWGNRIPGAAWALMGLIAVSCNVLLGYGEHRTNVFLLILPIIVSISFFLIADIDSPRGGVIRVTPHNLISQHQVIKPL
jgi:hypothetical protein